HTQRWRYRQSSRLGREGRARWPPDCVGRQCLRSPRRRARVCHLQRRDEAGTLYDRGAERRRNHEIDFDSGREWRARASMSWVIWGGLVFVAAWVAWTYNGLVALKHQIQNGWKQIDVQLKRRHDLIPNLIETVKGYMKYEQETIQKVIEARSRAMASSSVKETAAAEGRADAILGEGFRAHGELPGLESQ